MSGSGRFRADSPSAAEACIHRLPAPGPSSRRRLHAGAARRGGLRLTPTLSAVSSPSLISRAPRAGRSRDRSTVSVPASPSCWSSSWGWVRVRCASVSCGGIDSRSAKLGGALYPLTGVLPVSGAWDYWMNSLRDVVGNTGVGSDRDHSTKPLSHRPPRVARGPRINEQLETTSPDRPFSLGPRSRCTVTVASAALRRGWRRLISMRTALVLLFLLAVAAVPGSLLPGNAH